MTEAEELLVKIHGPYPTYDRFNPCYPKALCSSCRRALYKIKAKQLPEGWRDCQPPSWKKFNVNKIFGVRKCGTFDNYGKQQKCDICTLVRSNPIGESGPNRPKMLLPRGIKEETISHDKSKDSLCSLCIGMKKKGISHKCGMKEKMKNLAGMLKSMPIREQKSIMASTMEAITKKRIPTNRSSVEEEISIGRLNVRVGRVRKGKVAKLTAKTFRRIEVEMDMSRGALLKLKRILKSEVRVDGSVREALREWDKKGADHLSLHRITNFELKNTSNKDNKDKNEIISRDVVVVKDIKQTIDWIVAQRGMEKDDTVARIYIDSGCGSLKVLASIHHRNEDSDVSVDYSYNI